MLRHRCSKLLRRTEAEDQRGGAAESCKQQLFAEEVFFARPLPEQFHISEIQKNQTRLFENPSLILLHSFCMKNILDKTDNPGAEPGLDSSLESLERQAAQLSGERQVVTNWCQYCQRGMNDFVMQKSKLAIEKNMLLFWLCEIGILSFNSRTKFKSGSLLVCLFWTGD